MTVLAQLLSRMFPPDPTELKPLTPVQLWHTLEFKRRRDRGWPEVIWSCVVSSNKPGPIPTPRERRRRKLDADPVRMLKGTMKLLKGGSE